MQELFNIVWTSQTKTLAIICVCILFLEICSGVTKAIKNKDLDSTKFREGLLSKTGYLVQIILVILVSMMLNMPYLLYADLLWISCSEGVSVLENLSILGVPFPAFVQDTLEKVKSNTEKEMDKDKK